MRRPLLAVVVAIAAFAAACSGDDTDRASGTSDDTRLTSSTDSATTTTRAADLAAAETVLTPVAPVEAATVIATRSGDDTLYVAEQGGRVLAVVTDAAGQATVLPTPVLDLGTSVRSGGEQGLLGVAFSPDGDRLVVHYSDTDGNTTVDEYSFTASPGGGGTVDPATRRTLFTLDQPQPNHNGGQLAFGPDGALYLGLGDGGGAGDQGPGHAPEGNGQSLDTLLGKIVRFDPTTGEPAIFASGLRNPWRFSFDRENDDLWVGDVGQNAWEEVTRLPFAQAEGANLGWPLLEGTHGFRDDAAPGTVLPVFEVSQDTGACAIVGGHVYRGTRIPDLAGAYLFTDNCDGRVRALHLDDEGNVTLERDLGISLDGPTTFGEDSAGELYVASGSEGVFRIDPA
jgi:glucose/arabinose dehydrogenase